MVYRNVQVRFAKFLLFFLWCTVSGAQEAVIDTHRITFSSAHLYSQKNTLVAGGGVLDPVGPFEKLELKGGV